MIFLCDENKGCSTDYFEEKQETSQVRRMLKVPRQTVPHSPMLHLVGFPPGRAATFVNHIIFGQSGEWVFTCRKSRFGMKDIEKGVS